MTTEPSFRRVLRTTWRLVLPYWRSEERHGALARLAVIVAINLGGVYVLVLLNAWNRTFYDALQQRDWATFAHQLGTFSLLATVFIVTTVYRQYLTQALEMRWRRWLTDEFLRRWLGGRVYHHLEQGSPRTDNPDQRIAEDIQLLASGTLALATGLLNAAVTLASFIGILWTLSGPLNVQLPGVSLTIPAYLVWAAVLYSLTGSILTHWIGRPLVGLNAKRQRVEAEFRFSLVRLRESAAEIALYGGEAAEQHSLRTRFAAIVENWSRLLRAQKRLTWFNAGYGQAAIVFPILAAAPRYFGGAIQLGELMQIASAFGRVQDALSWFVDSYARLAEWKASVDRLTAFERSMVAATVAPGNPGGLRVVPGYAERIVLTGVDLALPTGATIIREANAVIRQGERVLLTGPSGSGKSTVFRAIAGLWPYGRGEITWPSAGRLLFLPQRSYLPIASLREVVAYPSDPRVLGDAAIVAALRRCRLDSLALRLDEVRHWARELSPGEQQLLALARAFLLAPPWLFLDEATSALDETTEQHVYGELVAHLGNATIVSIAHRAAAAAYHERHLVLVPERDGARLRESPPAFARLHGERRAWH